MRDPVRITLMPLAASFEVERGTPLRDVLFDYGVEFPCGGKAQCEGCKIRILEGSVAVTQAQDYILTPDEIEAGWRLSCCCSAEEDVTLELEQWEVEILTDNTRIEITPRAGLGVAVDLGTTTLAAQLLDLRTGNVLAVQTALNQQGRFGADVMRRISSVMERTAAPDLTDLIRRQVGEMVAGMIISTGTDGSQIREVVVVGNTVMHHLFCGINVEPLSHYPFEPVNDGIQSFQSRDLGWSLDADPVVKFLPCLGGFVGSDILAGIIATGLHESTSLVGLVDLGTNGEVVIGNRDRLVCCSTAAGPAFEGSQISMGMRASTGAISEVSALNNGFHCRVIGNASPRGICGSGLVDAVAAGLDLKLIEDNGRFSSGAELLPICPPVTISQGDIRELQVAKAAIAAGFRILLNELGAPAEEISRLYLAGAFGNYINRSSAHRIGLIGVPAVKVQPGGNTALRGAKLSLFNDSEEIYSRIKQLTRHVPLNTNQQFFEVFVEEMNFPSTVDG